MRIIVPIYHKRCNGIAFYYHKYVVLGEVLEAKYATKLNGDQIITGEKIICGTCGEECPTANLSTERDLE